MRMSGVFSLVWSVCVISFAGSAIAQIPSSDKLIVSPERGTEFLIAFPALNWQDSLVHSSSGIDGVVTDTASYSQELCFANPQDTTVVVSLSCRGDVTLNRTLSLPPRGGITYRLSSDQHLLIETSEQTGDLVIRVKSPAPIALSAYNLFHDRLWYHGAFWYDAGGILEAVSVISKGSAGYAFRALTYYDMPINTKQAVNRLSEFIVMAFEDSTEIEIVPSCPTLGGKLKDEVLHYLLMSGQLVAIQTEFTLAPDDLSGSSITSNKPIAVQGALGDANQVPVTFDPNSNGSSGNLSEAMLPVSTWGRSFAVRTFAPHEHVISLFNLDSASYGDVVRVVALNDSTIIRVNGDVWGVPLAANEFRDSLIKSPILLQSSAPVQVGEYSHSAYWSFDSTGDSFLAVVPPLEETTNASAFYLSDDTNCRFQYLNIVTESSGRSRLVLDGKPVVDTFFHDLATKVDGRVYSVGALQVSKGFHSISSTNDSLHGFNVIAYATPSIIQSPYAGFSPEPSHYGFTASMAMRPLQSLFAEQTKPIRTNNHAVIQISSIEQEDVVLDSATLVLDSTSKARGYSVSFSRTVGHDLARLLQAAQDTVSLIASPVAQDTITGRITVYHHTAKWHDLYPAEAVFHIYPFIQSVSSPMKASQELQVRPIYPNPVGIESQKNLTLSMLGSAGSKAEVKIFDILGRQVGAARSVHLNGGWQKSTIPSPQVAGSYYVEIVSSGVRKVQPFVVRK